jgi:hypothetical protein
MWPYILGIVFIIACLLAYLFKAAVLGKAKVKLGATPFVLELDMQSNKRQISEKEFNLVNLSESYADSDLGFVIRKPLSKEWTQEKIALREIYEEKGFTEEFIKSLLERVSLFIEDPEKNVHALTIRRGAAQSIRYTEGTIVDGSQIDFGAIKSLTLYAEEKVYDHVTIFTYKKEDIKYKISLLDFFFTEAPLARGVGPKRLYVNPENTIFLLDCSALFEKVVYNGELGNHVINNAILFQVNDKNFFEVIISYVQSDDKPTEVWDELRSYLASFRVLVK